MDGWEKNERVSMKRLDIKLGKIEGRELDQMINEIRANLQMAGIKKKVSKNQAVKFLLFQKRNKRGQLYSLLAAFIFILFIGVVAFLVATQGDKITGALKDQSDPGTTEYELMEKTQNNLPNIVQSVFLIIFFGIGIATLVSSFLVRNMPVMSIFMVLILIIVVFTSPVIANMYDKFANTPENADMYERMSLMRYVFDWYPRIMFTLSVVAMIVMFAKGGGREG